MEAEESLADERGRFFQRRQVWTPTWRGWILIVLCLFVFFEMCLRSVHPFLAVNSPAPGGILVVEGWAPVYALKEAIHEFQRNHYEKVLVTGGPLEIGSPLSSYQNYAALGQASLVGLGLGTNEVEAVPAPFVGRDRTYESAVTLKAWVEAHGLKGRKLNLMTLGPHSRRSRLIFGKAFGKETTVGVISVVSQDYDAVHWWRSSQGVRTVISEVLAYVYARFFFHPKP